MRSLAPTPWLDRQVVWIGWPGSHPTSIGLGGPLTWSGSSAIWSTTLSCTVGLRTVLLDSRSVQPSIAKGSPSKSWIRARAYLPTRSNRLCGPLRGSIARAARLRVVQGLVWRSLSGSRNVLAEACAYFYQRQGGLAYGFCCQISADRAIGCPSEKRGSSSPESISMRPGLLAKCVPVLSARKATRPLALF